MRIDVNLASEPFRRDRSLIVASSAVALLLLATLMIFSGLAVAERSRTAEAREELSRLDARLRGLAAEQAKLDGTLRQPANAEVLDRIQFVNALLVRKGVSWTRIFADLEKVVPPNVRLIQIRPQILRENELVLDMVVGAQSSEPVVNLLMRLEASEQFGATTVQNWLPPSQSDPLFRYRVSVQYGQKL